MSHKFDPNVDVEAERPETDALPGAVGNPCRVCGCLEDEHKEPLSKRLRRKDK